MAKGSVTVWFLPILVVGAIAMAIARRSSRKAAPPSRQLAAGPAGPAAGAPGPISVLGEILRVGQAPPPTVILCAIAEARAIGRDDLASDIVKVFVAPVVYHHQRSRERASRPVHASYERGSCAVLRGPRHEAESSYSPHAPTPFEAAVPPPPPPATSPRSDAAPNARAAAAPAAAQPSPPLDEPSMDDEISALLHADPERFMEMVSRSGTFQSARSPRAPLAVPVPVVPPPPSPLAAPVAQPTELPPDTLARLQEAAGDPEVSRSLSLAPSPIPGVPDSSWRDFAARLARESPEFSSSRHVGQYRQRRERLAELGIDPEAVGRSAHAQRAALDADLADAYRHGVASELFAQHLGRPITLPGREGAETVTLSGVLGVVQSAGLEGAVGWLERTSDRKRYPHTTQAFLHTNGVF